MAGSWLVGLILLSWCPFSSANADTEEFLKWCDDNNIYLSDAVELRPSPLGGLGLFATKTIQVVCVDSLLGYLQKYSLKN